jgi:hypothetical protein
VESRLTDPPIFGVTVPLLCPYDSVYVGILQKTVFNVFNQSGPISNPQYAPNAIVVLEVEGSNPSSRPRINNLRDSSGNQTFAP